MDVKKQSVQGFQKLKHIMMAYRQSSSLKTVFHTTFQWAQNISGLSTSIFQQPAIDIPQLDQEHWIQTLRQFLVDTNIQLHIPSLHLPHPKRDNDTSVMDLVLSETIFTHSEKLKSIVAEYI